MKKMIFITLIILTSFSSYAEYEWYHTEVLVKWANLINSKYGTGKNFSKGWGLNTIEANRNGLVVTYTYKPGKICKVTVQHSKLDNGKDNLDVLVINKQLSDCPTR